jgi:hypothetical protein
MAAVAILAACTITFLIVAGFLLWHGRFGQRHMVWTMRMNDTRYRYRYRVLADRQDNEDNLAA